MHNSKDVVHLISLRKQPTFRDTPFVFLTKWRLRNERRNFILMTLHFPDLGSDSDWSLLQPITSASRFWVVTRHQYGISAVVSQTTFGGKKNSGVVGGCFLRLIEFISFCVLTFPGSCRQIWPCFGRGRGRQGAYSRDLYTKIFSREWSDGSWRW